MLEMKEKICSRCGRVFTSDPVVIALFSKSTKGKLSDRGLTEGQIGLTEMELCLMCGMQIAKFAARPADLSPVIRGRMRKPGNQKSGP